MVFVVFSALIHGFSGLEEVSCPKATKDSACGFNARVETLQLGPKATSVSSRLQSPMSKLQASLRAQAPWGSRTRR